MKITNLIPLW